MIAERDAQDLFGLFLLDHETVEVRLHVARLVVELEIVGPGFGFRAIRRGGCVRPVDRRGAAAGEMLPHELLQLPLEFLG